jgi:hypothetical protein
MSLASKPETPKVKVDMEAKLRAWLESKGKTKSIQRMNEIFSPTASKTPSSISQISNQRLPGSLVGLRQWIMMVLKSRSVFHHLL